MFSNLLPNLSVFAGAFGIAAITCGCVMRAACHFGFTDSPDEQHKHHVQAIPLGGGIGVFLAVLVTAVIALEFGLRPDDSDAELRLISLVFASLTILTVGIVDDRYGMRGMHKLMGQTVAASILVAGGYHFRGFEFSGLTFDVGSFGVILTMFWILGAVNAVNLIDGADGVAATLGIGICASLGVVAAIMDGPSAAVIPLAMSGALLGFLLYNFPPAKLYLGDSGSMLIGLIAAATAIQSSVKSQATFALAAPLALLSIPIMDTSLAIFRRKLMGRSIYDTDRGHLHHCLLSNGLSPRQVVAIVAALTLLTSIGAVGSIWIGLDLLSLLAVIIVLGICARWKLMGHGEIKLVVSRILGGLRKSHTDVGTPQHSFVHIQGVRNWESAWMLVVNFAASHGLDAVDLSASMPWLHESISGRYGNAQCLKSRSKWRTSIPLVVNGQKAGWIEFVSSREQTSTEYELVLQLVEQFELTLSSVASGGDRTAGELNAAAARLALVGKDTLAVGGQ